MRSKQESSSSSRRQNYCLIINNSLVRQTGLLCFTDEKKNEILMEKTINAFKANPGSDYELYYGEDFKKKYPYLKMGEHG